jgi:hypothetical protein
MCENEHYWIKASLIKYEIKYYIIAQTILLTSKFNLYEASKKLQVWNTS